MNRNQQGLNQTAELSANNMSMMSGENQTRQSERGLVKEKEESFGEMCTTLIDALNSTVGFFKNYTGAPRVGVDAAKLPEQSKAKRRMKKRQRSTSDDEDHIQSCSPKKRNKRIVKKREPKLIAKRRGNKESLSTETESGELSTDSNSPSGTRSTFRPKQTEVAKKTQAFTKDPFDTLDFELDPTSDSESDDQFSEMFGAKGECGSDVAGSLAESLNNALCMQMDDAKVRELCEKIKRPGNCHNLVVPKTNETVWKSLTLLQKSRDLKLQKTQGLIVKSLCSLIQALDRVKGSKKKKESFDPHAFEENVKDSVKLLVAANSQMNHRRLEQMSTGINEEFKELVKQPFASNPENVNSTELLFGSRLNEKMKEISEEAKVAQRMGKNLKAGRLGPNRLGPNRPGVRWNQGQTGRGKGPLRRQGQSGWRNPSHNSFNRKPMGHRVKGKQ